MCEFNPSLDVKYRNHVTRMKNTVSDNEKINKMTEIRLFVIYHNISMTFDFHKK
jgi:hypothetical protein